MSNEMTLTTSDVAHARTKLKRMRRVLVKWLELRALTDKVASGALTTKKPNARAIAEAQVAQRPTTEIRLAKKLHALLSTIEPDVSLPNPEEPNAAVAMAIFAIDGKMPGDGATKGGMSGIGGAAHPWMWPALIVGGLLLAVTTAIHSAADVVKDREEKACIQAGACTDYGFWLKAAVIVGGAWFVWEKLGVGDKVKGAIKRL